MERLVHNTSHGNSLQWHQVWSPDAANAETMDQHWAKLSDSTSRCYISTCVHSHTNNTDTCGGWAKHGKSLPFTDTSVTKEWQLPRLMASNAIYFQPSTHRQWSPLANSQDPSQVSARRQSSGNQTYGHKTREYVYSCPAFSKPFAGFSLVGDENNRSWVSTHVVGARGRYLCRP